MKILALMLFLLLILPATSEAQRRTRKKPPQISQEEAQAIAEAEYFQREELEQLRKLDPVQRTLISQTIEKLDRACELYKITGSMDRVEEEFFSDENLKVVKASFEILPKGNLRTATRDAISILSDALMLNAAYYGSERVSNSELLGLIKRYELSDIPRHRQVAILIESAWGSTKDAARIARRAGFHISVK
jgi:hypothetical protein